ncbi:hypothetical protein DY000_02004952 [Brassica cretica]|uniref:Uncharacterized protein n=1 Tax=Brassica cretica TaxID=69181 RepID=A0ABQ7CHP2_BRACR|nr:hypothetical protein DY000_02004952 [Brassica cretica]
MVSSSGSQPKSTVLKKYQESKKIDKCMYHVSSIQGDRETLMDDSEQKRNLHLKRNTINVNPKPNLKCASFLNPKQNNILNDSSSSSELEEMKKGIDGREERIVWIDEHKNSRRREIWEEKIIPNGLLQDCKSLQNLSLHNNPISMDEFRLMEGLDLEDCPKKESLGHGFYADFTMATRITIPDFITEFICYILQ